MSIVEPTDATESMEAESATLYPCQPRTLKELGDLVPIVANLILKIGATLPNFDTESMIDRVKLPLQVVEESLWGMKEDKLVEILGKSGRFGYRYALTRHGLEFARRLMEICGYLGPAPVSLQEYTQVVEQQSIQHRRVTIEKVNACTAGLILPQRNKEVAALAADSRRSLFIFGPSGNGKSALGRMLHDAVASNCLVPYSIAVDQQVIRVYDPQLHRPVAQAPAEANAWDNRWVNVQSPLVVAGGEMRIEQLDLVFQPSTRYYEAPLHLKANGGTFFIDDLGRQRIDPHDLLNRWIMPLESSVDYLALANGQKVRVPFHLMLIVATNMRTSDVADPAFLRRMGYRIHICKPSRDAFRQIIRLHAMQSGLTASETMVDKIIRRYETEGKQWRASEPRDLFQRCQDICRMRNIAFIVDDEMLDLAWHGYFADGSDSELDWVC